MGLFKHEIKRDFRFLFEHFNHQNQSKAFLIEFRHNEVCVGFEMFFYVDKLEIEFHK